MGEVIERNPMDVGVGTEPGELAFGVVSGVLSYHVGGLFKRPFAVQVPEHLLVSDGVEGIEVAEGHDSADFVEESLCEHGVHSGVDAGIEVRARPLQSYL